MTEVRLTDERLAWLAARDQIRAETKPSLFMRLLVTRDRGWSRMGGTRNTDVLHDMSDSKRAAYAIAVDDTTAMLSRDERQALRRDGVLPAWFMPEVRRRVQKG